MSSAPNLSIFRLEAGTHQLIERGKIGLLVVSCLRLVGTGNVGFNDHRRRISAVSHSLGKLTGRLGVPMLTLSRLSHGMRGHRNLRKGQPRLDSLHRSKTVRRSTSVMLFIRHPRCCRVCRSRGKGSLRNVTRVVVTGRHGNTAKSMLLGFHNRFAHFRSPASSCAPMRRNNRVVNSGVGDKTSSKVVTDNTVPPPPVAKPSNPLPF